MHFARPPIEQRDRLRRAHMVFKRVFDGLDTRARSRGGILYNDWFNAYGASRTNANPAEIEAHLEALLVDPLVAPRAASCAISEDVFDADGSFLARGDCVRFRDGSLWAIARVEVVQDEYGRLQMRKGKEGMMRIDRSSGLPLVTNLFVDVRSRRLVGGRLVDVV